MPLSLALARACKDAIITYKPDKEGQISSERKTEVI